MTAIRREEAMPHNVEAEQQLLGMILTNNDALDLVADILTPELFFDPVHSRIYRIAAERISKGHLVSPVALRSVMENDPGLADLGGPKYLVRLAGAAISASAAREYAKLIVEMAARRALTESLTQAQGALLAGTDSPEVKTSLLHALHALPEASGVETTFSLAAALAGAADAAVKSYQGQSSFLPTGIEALDRIIRGLGPSDYCLIGGATSMGKAQPLTSAVLRADGWAKMGDIRVGDKLASADGAPSEVVGVFPLGSRAILKITFSDGRSVRCCEDHLWEVGGSFFGCPRVITAADLRKKMQMSHSKGRITVPLFSGEFGEDVPLLIDPWVLGAFIGNGYFADPGNPILSTADAQTLWRFAKAIGPEHEVVAAGGYDYRVKGKVRGPTSLAQALQTLGLRGCRSEQKFIPEVYLRAGRAVRMAVLQGLLDTDGWVEKFGAVRFSTASPVLAEQVAYLVRSLGGVCSTSVKQPKYRYKHEDRVGQTHFILNIRHPRPSELFSVIHKQRRCGRQKPVTLTVVSVEPDGVEEVQCIKVSHPRALYVTDDFVLTHNTSLALEIAANVAIKQGKGVCFVSLEMTKEELATRMASAVARVPYAALRSASDMPEDDFRKWIEAVNAIKEAPMHIVPKHVRDIPSIHAAARKVQRQMDDKLALLVVDYAQLVRAPGKGRYEQMTDVSIGIKHMAGLLGVPVIALCQLSRDIGQRDDKRPQLSDIKESGQFENDADQVIFCHREGYWLQRQGPKPDKAGQVTEKAKLEWQADLDACKNVMELIVRKNRHGRLGTAQVGFHDATGRFWKLRDDVPSWKARDDMEEGF